MTLTTTIIDEFNQISIDTDRLSIKKLTSEYTADCLRHEQDEEMLKYIKDLPSLEEAKALVEMSAAPWSGEEGQWMTFAIIERFSGSYIGEVFCRYESIEFKRIEIGFRLAKAFHQKGIMSEALSAFLAEVTRIAAPIKFTGFCVAENTASMKTMQKQGFEQEGLLRKHSTLNGVWYDERVFGRVL